MSVRKAKENLRREIWATLQSRGIARFPLPCYGRIPNFAGSEKAAQRLRLLEEWKEAKVVFVNPDFAQDQVRKWVLLDNKTLVMATPRLKQGLIVITSDKAKGLENVASTISGAFQHGQIVKVEQIPRPDLIVEGSVAVDLQGNRLGKGGGYGDEEIKTLKRAFGHIVTATTVHDFQVVHSVPFEEKDEKISIIVTPTRTIRIRPLEVNEE